MARTNVKTSIPPIHTHEGAPARRINATQQLRRLVLSCLLWEDEHYVDGKSIADQIGEAAAAVSPRELAALAIEARSSFNLRHVPLLLLDVLTKTGAGTSLVSETIYQTIQRADELAEFLSIYWRKGKHPLSAQVKKGLAKAFTKFDAYQLGKYNRDNAIKLRDVLFLVKAKPLNEEMAATWKKLVDGTLESPDSWEVNLSGGKNKKETFERLIREDNLGYLALLRNVRGMVEAGVDRDLLSEAIVARKNGAHRVLPFRYLAAARACPQMEAAIDKALLASIDGAPKLNGLTCVMVDVSGSMDANLSGKSDLKRIDAAAALASVIPGDTRVFSFSNALVECPPRKGMAGVDAIIRSQMHSGTYLGRAVADVMSKVKYDRLIVISDEQSHDPVPQPLTGEKHYMINVASNRNGVGYGKWQHVDGFSESILRFIAEMENVQTD